MPNSVTVPGTDLEMTLELLDPKKITGPNIRNAKPDKKLIDSVRARGGNHSPIGVLRTPAGDLLRFGERRQKACAKAGCDVLAIVIEGTAGTPEAEIVRIFEQLDENDNREDLTAADRAMAVATLFDLGVDEKVVATNTGLSKGELAAARKVAASETGRTVAAQYPLNLEQAGAVAEFDGDEKTVAMLVEAAEEGPGRFAHALQDARNDRYEQELINAHAAGLTAKGVPVTVEHQVYTKQIENWADADGNKLTPETHKDCPGNLVLLRVWGDDKVHETWFCTDPQGNGHRTYKASTGEAGQSKEAEAAERQRVLAGNKEWRSAETVRRTYLRELLGRPKVPEGAHLFTLKAFALSDSRLQRFGMAHRMSDGQHAMARELLGIPKAERSGWGTPPEVWTAMTKASPDRAEVIALGIVLGSYEASTGVHSWRNPSAADAEFLELLAGWSYQLSDIEQELVTAVRQKEAERAAVIAQEESAAAEHDEPADEPVSG